MSHSVGDASTLEYIITHVFCPLQLPNQNDYNPHNSHSLAKAIVVAAHLYGDHVGQTNLPQWNSVMRMLENLQDLVQNENLDTFRTISLLDSLNEGDSLALPIRAQNAGAIFRRQGDVTTYESIELSPKAQDVMTTEGKLICSYPGPAIEIPNFFFDDKDFRSELVNFLVHMSRDDLDSTSWKEQSSGFKDTTHPRYITELLTGILRGVGRPANIIRIHKRVGDDVICNDPSKSPWRRSALWLLIRVALQTTLDRLSLRCNTYKEYMLFFMCYTLEHDACAMLSNDLLHFMSAKISRRLQKLGSSASGWLSRTVLQTCTSLRVIIDSRWQQIEAARRLSPPWNPSQLNLTRDTQLSLLSSGDYLSNSLASHTTSPSATPVDPQHRPRGTLCDFLSSDGGYFKEAYHIKPQVALFDVERAVEEGIDAWVERVIDKDEACVKLELLACNYSLSASETYANNPELLSIMVLTTIELWVALDKIAIRAIPMLADYSPEVPANMLEYLLLRKSTSLNRLRIAHEYLFRRYSKSHTRWSAFSSTVDPNSFSVRFYSQSSHLWYIETGFRSQTPHSDKFCAMIKSLQTSPAHRAQTGRYAWIWDNVHEWLWPTSRLLTRAVVFEFGCPVSFNMWRTATLNLLLVVNCSSPSSERATHRVQLTHYRALRQPLLKHLNASVPFYDLSATHGAEMWSPTEYEIRYVRSGLELFNPSTSAPGTLTSHMPTQSDITTYFAYKLPSGPYQNLQQYVVSTSHTSNQVIANQADCDEDLSIHEYMAFGHLRGGGLLQWLNILRELRGRWLTFRRPEVHMLLAQAASQVGPLDNTGWKWHQEVQQPTFCYALLHDLKNLIQDVEANWTEGVTMDTISFLLRRLLMSSPDVAISSEATHLLHTVRGKVFAWVCELSARIAELPGDEGSHGILRDAAAICRSTFDVDAEIIPRLLSSPEDIDTLLTCAIVIHNHMPSDVSRLPPYARLLLDRNHRLSLVLEHIISDLMQTDVYDRGVNLAVQRAWPSFRPGSKWTTLTDRNVRWLSCTTMPLGGQHPQVVQFDILGGSLLVDGKLAGYWLPKEFVRHPLYKFVFGEKLLVVVQGNRPGVDYATKDFVFDHQVFFSLRNSGRDLIIRARRKQLPIDDPEIMELIPHQKMEKDLPRPLIEGHAHWLNLATSIMEVRPLERIWETSSVNWRIDCTPGRYRMQNGKEYLVDIRSQSWNVVSSLFRPLALPQDLIISVSLLDSTQSTTSLRLSVHLPRYDMSFYVNEDGEFQSRNIRSMVYDEDQSIGTLFGLVNQLVLRPKAQYVDTLPRCILIPEGRISFRKHGHHVHVEITPDGSAQDRIMYQTYRVHSELGCLTGDGSLTSKLYCAYLHALTSGCSEDPLTGRSGTEEALSVLQSASCCSAMKFSPRDVELLNLIASLSPSPTLYASCFVQKVKWHDLPASSQSHELYVLCKKIKGRYEKVQRFQGSSPELSLKYFPSKDDHLHKRMAWRMTCLYPSGFSEQPFAAKADTQYAGRDLVDVSSAEHRAYLATTYVQRRYLTSGKDLWSMMKAWDRVSGVSGGTALSLQYNRSWLAPYLPSMWLQIYNLLREDNQQKWSRMLFTLPAMAYASSNLSDLVPVFVAFAGHSQFQSQDPPRYDSYQLSDGYEPSSDTLRSYVIECAHPFEPSPVSTWKRWAGLMNEERQRQAYEDRRRSDADATASKLVSAWPLETCPSRLLDPNSYDVSSFTAKVQDHFSSPFRNLRLEEHVTGVQTILSSLPSHITSKLGMLPSYSVQPSQSVPLRVSWQPSIHELFARPAPRLKGLESELSCDGAGAVNAAHRADTSSLHQLISRVAADAVSPFHHQYLSALRASVESFEHEISLVNDGMTKFPAAEALTGHYSNCRTIFIEALQHLQRCLGPRDKGEEAIKLAGQWPRITASTLFRCLASNSPITLPNHWKTCIVGLALLAQKLQRARRLVLLHLDDLREDLVRELQNSRCDGWDDEAHPDWLLVQLQGNFLIRRVQIEVANEMISPRSSENTAMQLNMGEGKSSVIVPIAAAVLANGEQLVRVVVPKPLIRQTFHLLADRLCGLANRRIYYLPFSRSLRVDDRMVDTLREIMLECMQERGILVVQPEHILSLKLLSVEKQLSRESGTVGHKLLELQMWLQTHARDILDESDDILDVRSQLIFTIGHQQNLEGSPERWTTIQQILGLVDKHASSLSRQNPFEIEYGPHVPGSFPYLRILQPDAGKKLISLIVQDIMAGHLPNISFGHLHFHEGLEDAVHAFISSEDISTEKTRFIKELFGKTPVWGVVLLLRGLLALGILSFVFRERRWRVDYGLAPTRTMLAVPYRAKDVPAEKAEFGHPDIAIILTCLSYYYAGLTGDQLKHSFEILFERHDPASDYELWLRACPAVPVFLRTINGININSSDQWVRHLVPLFSLNRATIDFYLSNVVFPREAKEFPSRLPSSGWDLAEKKDRPVTGFSGTNDGQHLFPLDITQRDPEHQRGTNAKVLSYLLQPENNHYMCVNERDAKRRTTQEFLEILVAQEPKIRVLLDVGAQMLDLQNYELARAWLDISLDASAAVYFSEDDELMVCTRDGSTELLQSSPFAQQIDRCVIYLDDAHTRGTDIRFPSGFRAAVTLGPKITKDRLVQGCMRMRKLGSEHSIMFFAPLEVDRRIRTVASKDKEPSVLNTADVLHWAIRETWENIHRWAPLWVQQRRNFASRRTTWSTFCNGQLTINELSEAWLQVEMKRLEDLYEPCNTPNFNLPTDLDTSIYQRCADLGVLSLSPAGLDEEQERERQLDLAYEVRQERQVRRPPSVPHEDHIVHQDVIDFIRTGIIPKGTRSTVFVPAWNTLRETSAATSEAYIWSRSVMVTADFAKTIQGEGKKLDDFIRPVQWVVSATRNFGDILVVFSPHEVNCLLSDIRSSDKVRLHLYTPYITKSVKPRDNLGLYSIPVLPEGWTFSSAFVDQLNAFAGQLYFSDYESYIRLCRFLGVYARDLEEVKDIVMEPDGFILPRNRNPTSTARAEIAHTFASSPLTSLKALMDIRCKGMDYSSTHMGKLLQGRLLSQNDFSH